ncbi:MAG: hypothetical protein MI864_11060 [Pseudomonadales bacterium]|nr:hypothetical protein [Pseudomonadales bacterium]
MTTLALGWGFAVKLVESATEVAWVAISEVKADSCDHFSFTYSFAGLLHSQLVLEFGGCAA